MASSSSSGKPSGTYGLAVLGFGGDHIDKQGHSEEVNNEPKSPLDLELQGFQDLVFSQFNTLSASSAEEFLSIDWTSKLLDAFVACQENFTSILLNNAGNLSKSPSDHRLLTGFFDRSVKALDICNVAREGIEKVRVWHNHLDIVSNAFDSKHRDVITEPQFKRARKALSNFSIVLVDDHKGKNVKKQGHSKSISWSVPSSWSASKELKSMANGLGQPRANELSHNFGLANCVYTMGFVLMFVLWTVVAAIPCQGRGVSSLSLPNHFSWSNSLTSIHTRVLAESKKRERKNSAGLLREIHLMQKSINLVSNLIDSPRQFPLTEEQQKEVKEGVQQLSLVCDPCKEGLDKLDRQLREMFNKIRDCRTEGFLNKTQS